VKEPAVILPFTTWTFPPETAATIAVSLAITAILILVVLLLQKELANVATGSRYKKLGQAVNIGIIPLFVAFIVLVASKVIEFLK
jgi:hypothetical protein